MREYFLEDVLHPNGGITVRCKDDNDCVFCKHCTDVFWDYTNLIYMIICDLDRNPWERPCACFAEAEEQEMNEHV
jgi:hypothetical protein